MGTIKDLTQGYKPKPEDVEKLKTFLNKKEKDKSLYK